MIMPIELKQILKTQGISLDTNKDYSSADLLVIYERVIQFMDRKIKRLNLPTVKEEKCTTNLSALTEQVKTEFETLGYESLAAKYNMRYLSELCSDERYTIAEAIVYNCRTLGIPVAILWTDLVANYGIIPKIYEA